MLTTFAVLPQKAGMPKQNKARIVQEAIQNQPKWELNELFQILSRKTESRKGQKQIQKTAAIPIKFPHWFFLVSPYS